MAAIEALLKAGASVEAANKLRVDEAVAGMTALMHAAKCGHAAAVEALLKAGASVEAANKDGWTALRWAEANRHQAVVELLRSSRPTARAGTSGCCAVL